MYKYTCIYVYMYTHIYMHIYRHIYRPAHGVEAMPRQLRPDVLQLKLPVRYMSMYMCVDMYVHRER